uniref:Uncharacterized protein n=1 Tax=Eutreptiella gymnastica TaxID=73025 RepID=A0A7S4LBX5_9EUGL|mmetsp:Transcript_91570/g.153412  ORF Transcript_91570/g.153412 Transcript_91570/m.153412 type:complete len:116 (+) Transcript_91570:1098-1445(+)
MAHSAGAWHVETAWTVGAFNRALDGPAQGWQLPHMSFRIPPCPLDAWGCPPGGHRTKWPSHGQGSVHGALNFYEGQPQYVRRAVQMPALVHDFNPQHLASGCFMCRLAEESDGIE